MVAILHFDQPQKPALTNSIRLSNIDSVECKFEIEDQEDGNITLKRL